MADLDATHILGEVRQRRVPAEWTVFPAQPWFFVRQGAAYLLCMLIGVYGIWSVTVNGLQQPALFPDRGDAFMLRCVFGVFVALVPGCLAAAVYQFGSVPKARDQVLVVTPDGFVTNAIRQRFSARFAAQPAAVAFADLRSLIVMRPLLAQRKCVELQYRTPVVSMPSEWNIPRQFLSEGVW